MAITEAALPADVAILLVYPDGHRLLLCRSARHARPRDYVRGPEQSTACPLCVALAADDAHAPPEAA